MDQYLSIVNSGGVLLVGAWLVYQNFRSGSSTIKQQVTDAYKERNQQLETDIAGMKASIESQGKEIARLQGTVEEKDKHIHTLTELVQGRNPEMISVLKEIRDFMKDLHDGMSSSAKVLDYQSKLLEEGAGDAKK